MEPIIPEYRFDVILIDLRIGITDRDWGEMLIICDADLLLIKDTYLRIGYNG
ncbi:MAG: hypothetical protein MJ117_11305 [Lachnospiraceae bacterium]|nr:hypothetical protein [Lachnospiraceae bacterium]